MILILGKSFEGLVILLLHYINCDPTVYTRASLVAERLKHLPAMRETRVRSLDWEDPLEKEMATHSSYSCLENSVDK